jgi:hypothetical protein
MIRLSWLQARLSVLIALAGLVIVAVVALITGPGLVHLYDTTVAGCNARGDCQTATKSFIGHDSTLRTWLGILVIVVPGLLGVFWGAPLVAHEFETGTFKVAWTQSVTRPRWLVTKIVILGLAAIVIAGLLSLVVTWWASPLDTAHASQYTTLDQRGLVPLGYAAFAFVLGTATGTIIRRTLPAMVTTLAAFVAARIALSQWVRPHLLPAAHTTVAVTSAPNLGFAPTGGNGPITFVYGTPSIHNSWVRSARLVDHAGHPATASSLHQFLTTACPSIATTPTPTTGGVSRGPANPQVFNDCLARISAHYHLAVTYQPASHYWPLQGYETAIFLAAGVLLAVAAGWWIRHRAT